MDLKMDVELVINYATHNNMDNKPEAMGSITFTVKIEGFPALYTVRDADSGRELLKKLPAIVKGMKEIGMIPDERFKVGMKKPTEYVEGRVCPTCGNKLVYKYKKDGGKYIRCSTNVWNPQTQTATGCQYVNWMDNKSSTPQTTAVTPPDPTEEF